MRRISAIAGRARLPLALAAALVVGLAGSCGGGGRSLADMAAGDWTCAYRQTTDVGGQAFGSRVTATITADSDRRGGFRLRFADANGGGHAIALGGDWRLSGDDLEVAITRSAFGGQGTIDYRGVAEGARQIEVKGGPSEAFKPVAVARRGNGYEFRWEAFDGVHARLTCRRA
jgi:hypothetical protein